VERQRYIDAARGTAMLFVLIAHFQEVYFLAPHDAQLWLTDIGLIASPTFICISGIVVGLLHDTTPETFERLRVKLVDRGLFLLTVTHLLILVATRTVTRQQYVFITDVIGVALLTIPAVVSRTRVRTMLACGATIYVLAWAVALLWHPHVWAMEVLEESAFGRGSLTHFRYVFPLIPWLCVYLVSAAIGKRLAFHQASGEAGAVLRFLVRTGFAAIGTAIAWHFLVARIALVPAVSTAIPMETALMLSARTQKLPPGPVYLLFHGGLALLLLAGWYLVEKRRMHRLLAVAGDLGRASLVAFIIQYYVYYVVLRIARPHLHYADAWPAYLIGSMLLAVLPAVEWQRRGYNRFVTVGYDRFHHWYTARRRARLNATLGSGRATPS
jgi:hypothetical protein